MQIAEPLVTEIIADKIWTASITDTNGNDVLNHIDQHQWRADVTIAISLLGELTTPRQLIIIHPKGYAQP